MKNTKTIKLTPEEKFKTNIDKASSPRGCHLWTGGHSQNGYGLFNPTRGTTVLAHRYAYELVHGKGSATGKYCMHSCDVRDCINPAHLSLGTPLDNVRDMVAKGRSRKGISSPVKRFTDAEKKSIIELYKSGSTQYAIAKQFSRKESVIDTILAPYKTSKAPVGKPKRPIKPITPNTPTAISIAASPANTLKNFYLFVDAYSKQHVAKAA